MSSKKNTEPKKHGAVIVQLGEKKEVLAHALPIVKALTFIYGASLAAGISMGLSEELCQQIATCTDSNQRLAELIELEIKGKKKPVARLPKRALPKKKPVAKKK